MTADAKLETPHGDLLDTDPYSKEAYRQAKELLAGRVSKRRLRHSANVAKIARSLAKTYHQDPDKARLAGILHDWDKGLSNVDVCAKARSLKVDVDEMVLTDMPWLLHGPTAAADLAREYPSIDAEVFQAIARHTSGAGEMSPLDCIIYVADIIEPDRTFGDMDGIERLRGLVATVSLEELYFEAFKYTLQFLVSSDRVLYPATIDAWNILMRTYGHVAKSGIDIWKY